MKNVLRLRPLRIGFDPLFNKKKKKRFVRTKQYEVKLIYHIAILALLCDMSSIQLKEDDEVKSLQWIVSRTGNSREM